MNFAFNQKRFSYAILAPVGRSGIAFIGDPDKFVTSGRKRIESVEDTKVGLRVTAVLSQGEQSITLCGYAPRLPLFFVYGGFLVGREFDSANHIFRITLQPQADLKYRVEHGDKVGRIGVQFKSTQ